MNRTGWIFIITLLATVSSHATTRADCDSMIRQGIRLTGQGDFAKALSLLTDAGLLAKQKRWTTQQFLAANNTGLVYYLMYDYAEALSWFTEAYGIALQEKETRQEMTVLNNIAVLYSREKEFGKALPYFEKAYELAKANRLLPNTGYYAINLGTLHDETGELTTARAYLEEAIRNLSTVPEQLLCARITLAENCLLAGNAQRAQQMILPLVQQAKDSGYRDMQSQALLVLAKAYHKEKNSREAIAAATEARGISTDLEERINIQSLLADIYTQSGAALPALSCKDSVIGLKDSMYKVRNGRVFENRKVKFELQNYQHELAMSQENLQRQQNLFYGIGGALLAGAFFLFWWLRNRALQARQKRTLAENGRRIAELEREREKNEKLILEKQVQEQETAALLESERHKNELELKNRNLLAKAMYLTDRNEQIEDLILSLSGLSCINNNEGLSRQVSQLRSHLKRGEETESFFRHFEEVNGSFTQTLQQKHPSLTANDIRFLSYIYMNLSNKEIGGLLNITPEGCRKRKERILKKMELPSEMSLYQYLQEL